MISKTSSVAARSYGGVQILARCDLGIPKPSQIVKAQGSCNITGDIQYACMRLLLDSATLVAEIRCDAGASRQLLVAALERRLTLIVSVTLMIEYQAVMTRPEHLEASALSLPLGVGQAQLKTGEYPKPESVLSCPPVVTRRHGAPGDYGHGCLSSKGFAASAASDAVRAFGAANSLAVAG